MNKNLKTAIGSWMVGAVFIGLTYYTDGLAQTMLEMATIVMASNSLVYFIAYQNDDKGLGQ